MGLVGLVGWRCCWVGWWAGVVWWVGWVGWLGEVGWVGLVGWVIGILCMPSHILYLSWLILGLVLARLGPILAHLGSL